MPFNDVRNVLTINRRSVIAGISRRSPVYFKTPVEAIVRVALPC